MKCLATLGLVMAIATTTACVPLLQPFYRAGQEYFDPSYLGVWTQGDSSWEVTRAGDASYLLVHRLENGYEERLTGRLVRLGERVFLDLELDWDPSNLFPDGALPFYLYPVHHLFLVESVSEGVRLRDVNEGWLGEHLNKKSGALKHHGERKDILLADGPEELQAFFTKHAGEAFGEGDIYKRAPATH